MVAASTLRRFHTKQSSGRSITLSALHPAYRSGRTMFPSRVFDPSEVARLLKDGHQARKIGKTVMKGRLRGAPIYTLTLEGRATGPRTCAAWSFCFGNHMQGAERIVAGAELEAALWDELAMLQERHPGGFLVRLHILGDFYSVRYAELWAEALAAYPALHVFGYTARHPDSEIGEVVARLFGAHPDRWHFRFSGLDAPTQGSIIVERAEDTDRLVCPAQQGKTACCASCGICWGSDITIAFLRH